MKEHLFTCEGISYVVMFTTIKQSEILEKVQKKTELGEYSKN